MAGPKTPGTHLYIGKPAYPPKFLGLLPGTGSHGRRPHQDGGRVSFFSLSLGLASAGSLSLFLHLCLCLGSFVLPPARSSPGSPHLPARDSARVTWPPLILFLHLFVSGTPSLAPATVCPLAADSVLPRGFQARTGQAQLGAEPQPSPAPTPSRALFPPPRRPAPSARPPGPRSPLSAKVSRTRSPGSLPVVPRGRPGPTAPVRRAGEARRQRRRAPGERPPWPPSPRLLRVLERLAEARASASRPAPRRPGRGPSPLPAWRGARTGAAGGSGQGDGECPRGHGSRAPLAGRRCSTRRSPEAASSAARRTGSG